MATREQERMWRGIAVSDVWISGQMPLLLRFKPKISTKDRIEISTRGMDKDELDVKKDGSTLEIRTKGKPKIHWIGKSRTVIVTYQKKRSLIRLREKLALVRSPLKRSTVTKWSWM